MRDYKVCAAHAVIVHAQTEGGHVPVIGKSTAKVVMCVKLGCVTLLLVVTHLRCQDRIQCM